MKLATSSRSPPAIREPSGLPCVWCGFGASEQYDFKAIVCVRSGLRIASACGLGPYSCSGWENFALQHYLRRTAQCDLRNWKAASLLRSGQVWLRVMHWRCA